MPNRGDRGGAQTRARIAAVATKLFIERGFDNVTIAEVAVAAGVSKVTVFAHFECKEDLLLDLLPDAVDIVRTAIRDRADGVDAIEAIRQTALTLAAQRHPLSGLSEGEEPFMRAFMNSPSLIARLRAFEHEIETAVAADLQADAGFSGNSALVAALLVAAYRTVAVESVRRRLNGVDLDDIATTHHQRLNEAFDAVDHGVAVSQFASPTT